MNRLTSLIILTVMLASCAPSQTTATNNGVEGRVTIGPMCPVVRIDQPCPDQPYAATLTVLNLEGKQIAKIEADANGHYRLLLVPGNYIMEPESPNAMPHAQFQPFTVIAGQFTKLDIVYDSGIR